MAKRKLDAHTEHCCLQHGCKYGNKDCSVVRKRSRRKQSHPCEACESSKNDLDTRLAALLELPMPWTDDSIVEAVRSLKNDLEYAWEQQAGEDL
jgi:hypothetical protein